MRSTRKRARAQDSKKEGKRKTGIKKESGKRERETSDIDTPFAFVL